MFRLGLGADRGALWEAGGRLLPVGSRLPRAGPLDQAGPDQALTWAQDGCEVPGLVSGVPWGPWVGGQDPQAIWEDGRCFLAKDRGSMGHGPGGFGGRLGAGVS